MTAKFIEICICTFRRPHIEQTLLSLLRLEVPGDWQVRVLVVDNDDTPSAQELVKRASASLPYRVQYVHAPARNISIARNACLENASAPLIAFIDDDELVQPQWLKALVTEQEASGAAAVLGPVDAIYPPDAPTWMRRGDFHATRPVWVYGSIITGYSCNLLLERNHPSLQGLRFQLDLGQSGGEDTMFLSTMHANGGRIAYAATAMVEEPVTPPRAHLSWLMKRRFRSGQTLGMTYRQRFGRGIGIRLAYIGLSILKMLFCLAMIPLSLLKSDRMVAWLLRATLHAGAIAKLAGKRELQQYG